MKNVLLRRGLTLAAFLCAMAGLSQAQTISGNIRTENGQIISNATIWLNGPVSLSTFSDDSGNYSFQDLPDGAYEVCPELNTYPNNGITGYDLLLMNRHIVGNQMLGSPYKIIAADVVGDGSITDPNPDVADIIALRQLNLQIILEFPNGVPSWVFLPADHSFPDPTNPWYPAPPPSCKTVIVAGSSVDSVDFIGVKKGDLNNSAVPY